MRETQDDLKPNITAMRDLTQRKQPEEAEQLGQADLENRVAQRTAELLAASAFLKQEIAERKQSEAALRESEERFRIMADTAPILIWLSGTDARCTFVNRPWLEFTGRTLEDQMGDGWSEGIHREDVQKVLDTYMKCFNSRARFMTEYRLRRFDGEYRWVLDTGAPRFTRDGAFAGYLGSIIDITDRKQAEILGAAQRLALQMIACGTSLQQIVEFLIGFVERQSGGALCSVLLLDADKGNLKLFAAPSLPEPFTAAIDGMAIGPCNNSCGTAAFLKEPVVVSDIGNDPLWAANREVALSHGLHACASVPIQAANGDLLGTCGMYYRTPREPGAYEDKVILIVSQLLGIAIEREHAEKALLQAEAKYRSIFENAQDGIFQSTPDGQFISANPSLARMFGYDSPEELIADRRDIERQHYVDPDRRATFKRLIAENGSVQRFELQAYRKDGSKIWTSENVRAVRDASGALLYYEGIVEDITEHKWAEKTRQLLSSIVESSSDAIVSFTADGRIMSWNAGAEKMFGYSQNEVIGRNASLLLPPGTDRESLPLFKVVEKGESIQFEGVRVAKDGRHLDVSITTSPIKNETGEVVGASSSVRDISDRKLADQMRTQLLQRLVTAQEDERRRLSRELHDQMGQSLAALKLGLKSLEDRNQLDGSSKARLQGLRQITDQLAQEVHTLARELRPTALDDFGLHTTLSNYVEEWSLRSQITADFHSNGLISQRLSPNIETTVYRIVQEALTNVVKHAHASNVSVIVEYRSNRVLAIVEDDGCGFDAETVMKAPLKERRLGLLGMQERVALVGGTLNVESTPGTGTTVLVRLPA